MYVEQLYTSCLAEAAYYIESNGEAAIIDPLRETAPYLAMAERRGATIKYIFETHFHADFVSGHIDLAKATGAKIVYGPSAQANYDIYVGTDGEEFTLGNISLKLIHTPGHTLESASFLLLDENKKPHALFSGDTLFVGDVGRPDLAVKGEEITQEHLASLLFDSIAKLTQLPDDVILYPGHGPGSACGKSIGKETQSTIGEQKRTNYALQETTREGFIKAVTEGQTTPPAYFFYDAKVNRQGYEAVDAVVARGSNPLSPQQVQEFANQGILILDTRPGAEFELGFIPNSLNIGLDGMYAIWVGTLIKPETELVVVASPGKEEEAVLRLARVGYENVKGVLAGGIAAWTAAGFAIDTLPGISATDFEPLAATAEVVDVRRPGEWANGVLENAHLLNLETIEAEASTLDPNQHYYVHCAGGYRSVIAASILKRKGIANVTNIYGGMGAIKNTTVTTVVPELV